MQQQQESAESQQQQESAEILAEQQIFRRNQAKSRQPFHISFMEQRRGRTSPTPCLGVGFNLHPKPRTLNPKP
jgi:hypothetical protein